MRIHRRGTRRVSAPIAPSRNANTGRSKDLQQGYRRRALETQPEGLIDMLKDSDPQPKIATQERSSRQRESLTAPLAVNEPAQDSQTACAENSRHCGKNLLKICLHFPAQ